MHRHNRLFFEKHVDFATQNCNSIDENDSDEADDLDDVDDVDTNEGKPSPLKQSTGHI